MIQKSGDKDGTPMGNVMAHPLPTTASTPIGRLRFSPACCTKIRATTSWETGALLTAPIMLSTALCRSDRFRARTLQLLGIDWQCSGSGNLQCLPCSGGSHGLAKRLHFCLSDSV